MTTQQFVEKYRMRRKDPKDLKREVEIGILSKLSDLQMFCGENDRVFINHIKEFVSDYFEIEETPSE